jgi:hypothetical protein
MQACNLRESGAQERFERRIGPRQKERNAHAGAERGTGMPMGGETLKIGGPRLRRVHIQAKRRLHVLEARVSIIAELEFLRIEHFKHNHCVVRGAQQAQRFAP